MKSIKTFSIYGFAFMICAIALIAGGGPVYALGISPDISHGALASIAIGGLIVNKQTLDAATRSFKTLFNNAFQAVAPEWKTIAMPVPSSTSANDYKWLGFINGMRKWLGDKMINNLTANGYLLPNEDYEDTVGVLRKDIEDDQIGVYTPVFKLLGDAAARHPDELVWQAVVDGFTTGKGFDGLTFFNTAHPIDGVDAANGTYANRPAVLGALDAWFLMDDSRPILPMIFQTRKDYHFVSATNPEDQNVFMQQQFLYSCEARVAVGYGLPQLIYGSRSALDATAFEAARAALVGMKRPDGSPLGIKPLTLVVGEAHFKEANILVNNERDAAGATNPWYKAARVVKVDYLNGK